MSQLLFCGRDVFDHFEGLLLNRGPGGSRWIIPEILFFGGSLQVFLCLGVLLRSSPLRFVGVAWVLSLAEVKSELSEFLDRVTGTLHLLRFSNLKLRNII